MRKQRIDGDVRRSQTRDGERYALAPAVNDFGIVPWLGGRGPGVDFDAIVRQVHDPILDNAVLGVKFQFGRAVADEVGIRHFDQEVNIGRCGMVVVPVFRGGRDNSPMRS